MEAVSFGNVPLMAEKQAFGEFQRIVEEDLSLGCISEVVEEVVVENTELRPVVTINELLVDLPRDRTHVPEL